MKWYRYFLLVAVVATSAAGCTSSYHDPDRAASGAGAASPIARGMDQQQKTQLSEQAPQTLQRIEESESLAVMDVKALAKAGVSDDLIISHIRNSRTIYHLRTADIIDLKESGVSERVIDVMINTPTQIPTTQAMPAPPPPPTTTQVIMVERSGYPWERGVWIRSGDHWVWQASYWDTPMYPRFHHHR